MLPWNGCYIILCYGTLLWLTQLVLFCLFHGNLGAFRWVAFESKTNLPTGANKVWYHSFHPKRKHPPGYLRCCYNHPASPCKTINYLLFKTNWVTGNELIRWKATRSCLTLVRNYKGGGGGLITFCQTHCARVIPAIFIQGESHLSLETVFYKGCFGGGDGQHLCKESGQCGNETQMKSLNKDSSAALDI